MTITITELEGEFQGQFEAKVEWQSSQKLDCFIKGPYLDDIFTEILVQIHGEESGNDN